MLPIQSNLSITIQSVNELDAFTLELSQVLKPGHVLFLQGELGAGKTTLVQSLAKHLGVKEAVNSPTFVLFQHYNSSQPPILHADCYRREDDPGFEEKLFELEECIASGQYLCLIEWAEKVPELSGYRTHLITLKRGLLENERIIQLTQENQPYRHAP